MPTSTASAAKSAPTTVEIPELSGVHAEPPSVAKLFRLLRSFGPAALLASLSIGAGETIMVTGLGAWAGYDLLWLLVASVLVKGIVVTYFIGRYTAVTGQVFAHRLAMLPGPRGWLLLLIVIAELSLISMGLTAVAKPCGNLVAYVLTDYLPPWMGFSSWENLMATLLLAAALVSSALSSYNALERQQVLICGILAGGTFAAMAMIGPDLGKLLTGAVSFGQLPPAPPWAPPAARNSYLLNLVTVFGFVGGSLSGYLAYSQWISLHGWGLTGHPDLARIRQLAEAQPRIDYLPADRASVRRMRALLAPLRWDITLGALVLLVVTAAFMSSGAEVLYPRRQVLSGDGFELLTKQASIWRQIHQHLVPVYYVVVVAALWGTLATVPEAVCRVAHDFLGSAWAPFRRVPLAGFQGVVSIWLFLTSLLWIWTGVSFDLLTQIGAFLTLSLGLGIVCLAAVYFNATLPRLYRPHVITLLAGAAASLILLGCAGVSGIALARKLLAAWST